MLEGEAKETVSDQQTDSFSDYQVIEQLATRSQVNADVVQGKLSLRPGPASPRLIGSEEEYKANLAALKQLSHIVADDCRQAQVPRATIDLFSNYAKVINEAEIIWLLADDLIDVIALITPRVDDGWSDHAAGFVVKLVGRHRVLRSHLAPPKPDEPPPEMPGPDDPGARAEVSGELSAILNDTQAVEELTDGSALFLGHMAGKVKSADPNDYVPALATLTGFILSLNTLGEKHKGSLTVVGFLLAMLTTLLKMFGVV